MKNILRNQKGQGIMEYVIISSLIGIFCLGMVGKFGKAINERIETMKEKVVKGVSL